MTISPIGNAGSAMTLLTASEDAAVQERLSRGAGVAKSDTGPQERSSAHTTADRTTFSHKFWNPEETIDFSMGTYTRNGTRIQVEAGDRALTLGNFANKGALENTFNLAGARAPLDMSVTFTTKDGNVTTYKINESMNFHETEEGMIVEGMSIGNKVRDPDNPDAPATAETNIVFNMDDKGTAVGGNGDDVLFNFGERGYVNGMEGDDTVINMADKAQLKGGEGDDYVKIVEDVIRDEKKSTLDLEAMGKERDFIGGKHNRFNLHPDLMVGALQGGQEVTVDGGDGNDVIDSRDTKLENATLKGGAGDDSLLLGDLVASTVKGGTGDDEIVVEDAVQSSISGGSGNDRIDVGRMVNSHIAGGSGDDHITVDHADGGSVAGGAGNDTIDMGISYRTKVTGGDGNDMISIGTNVNGTVEGGKGDDIIAVKVNAGGVIDGGDGDDLISVGSNLRTYEGLDWGSSVIMGGRGDDTILVAESDKSFIFGGRGDDTITVGVASKTLIAGGSGNDTVRTGLSWGNLIDGGSGKNDIQLNKFASPLEMRSQKPHNLTEDDVDMEALALFIKQLTNDGIEPGSEDEGMTLTDEQWLELARERLQKGVNSFGEQLADVVVDNGKLVQGTPDMLAARVSTFSDFLESTKVRPDQKRDMQSYLNSLKKLAQSEGAGTIFGKLAK